jgi:hypothetical protein
MSNDLFQQTHMTYNNALFDIQNADAFRLAQTKRKVEKFKIYRTDIPGHIPQSQHQQYTSTAKLTE